MSKTTVYNSGIGFTGLLTIAFIVLKLCNVITWSWIWVLSPIWISIGLVIVILLLILLGMGIYYTIKVLLTSKKKKWRMKYDIKKRNI